MNIIAVDIGGTNIKIGLVRNGCIVDREDISVQSRFSLNTQLPKLTGTIRKLREKQKEDCDGIGVAIACLIDTTKGRVIATLKNKYEDAVAIDFGLWAKTNFGLDIILETDSRAALVGEWQFGSGQGVNNLVMLTLGTGIGTSVLIRGKILKGQHFQAGLGGHFIINPWGRLCSCGGQGCVNAEASTEALPAIVREHDDFEHSDLACEGQINFETIFRLADKGDRLSIRIRDQIMDIWASAVVSLIHAFDPERVLLGGGIMHSADIILPHIQHFVDQRSWTPWGRVEIKRAQYLDEAALLGVSYIYEKGIDII